MIGLYRRFKERRAKQAQEREIENAMAILYSDDLFTDDQRNYLKGLFPTEWTHMDNFSQEEIFKIAVTMTLFGYACDEPAKMKAAMGVLHIQDICAFHPNNTDLIKRA